MAAQDGQFWAEQKAEQLELENKALKRQISAANARSQARVAGPFGRNNDSCSIHTPVGEQGFQLARVFCLIAITFSCTMMTMTLSYALLMQRRSMLELQRRF